MAAARTDSLMLLDRTTEQEGIVVDEGYCYLEDSSFPDAADRLALLAFADLETASKADSEKSLTSSDQNAANALKSCSSKSLGSKRSGPKSSLPPLSASHPEPSSNRGPSTKPAGVELLSARSSGNLPPGSPFGQQEFQNTLTPEAAEAKLKAMGLDNQLLSGLQSLSPEELSVYLQLSDELKREGKVQSSTSPAKPARGKGDVISSEEDGERLDAAVRKLKILLPEAAIARLQSHASYGLVDVLQSHPMTPPSTPTSTATDAQ